MVWAGISVHGRTELAVVRNGTMTVQRYTTDILNEHVGKFAAFVGDGFILIHDNARPHVVGEVVEFLRDVNIQVLDWPAQSRNEPNRAFMGLSKKAS